MTNPSCSHQARHRKLAHRAACLCSFLLLGLSTDALADAQVFDVSQIQVKGSPNLGWVDYAQPSPDGKHYYVSLWGRSGIAVFDHGQSSLTLKNILYNGSAGLSELVAPTEIAFSQDGTRAFVGSGTSGGSVHSFARDPGTGLLSMIDSHAEPAWTPREIAVTPSGDYLFVIQYFGKEIYTFNTGETGNLVNPTVTSLADFNGSLLGIMVSPDGKYLYANSYTDDITVLSISSDGSLARVQEFDSNTSGFEALAGVSFGQGVLAPDGAQVYFGDAGFGGAGNIFIFDRDPASGTLSIRPPFSDTLQPSLGNVYAMDIDPEGNLLCVVSRYRTAPYVSCMDRASDGSLSVGQLFSYDDYPALDELRSIKFSPDNANKGLFVVGTEGVVNRFDYSSNAASVAYQGADGYLDGDPDFRSMYSIVASKDGKSVYSASWTGDEDKVAILARNPGDGTLSKAGTIDRSAVPELSAPYHLVMSPDGRWVYVFCLSDFLIVLERNALDGSLGLVEVQADAYPSTGAELDGTLQLAVSPDSQYIYATSDRGAISIYAINANGTLTFSQIITPAEVPDLSDPFGIVFSPDGASAYVADETSKLLVFDRNTLDGSLDLVEVHPGDGSTGLTFGFPTLIGVDPSGKFLVFGAGTDGLYILSRDPNTGALSVADHLPGTYTQGVFHPKANLLAVERDTDKLELVRFDPVTGQLSQFSQLVDNFAGIDGLHYLTGLAFSSDGLHLYGASTFHGTVTTHKLDLFETVAELFDEPRDFLAQPPASDPFTSLDVNDGFDETQDAAVASMNADLSNAGALTVTSENATWRDQSDDGAFLGMAVDGDFEATLNVTSMDVAAGHSVGLMLRVQPGTDLEAGGPGQDYVTFGANGDIGSVSVFNTDNGTTTESIQALDRSGALAIEATEGLQLRIQRNGSVLINGSVATNGSGVSLSYRIGEGDWIDADVSPIDRPDFEDLVLEIGIYQTSVNTSTAVVDEFRIASDLVFFSSFD